LVPVPVQLCRETNWLGLETKFYAWGVLAWTTSGDLWEFSTVSSNAEASVTSIARLIATNSRADHVAYAIFPSQKRIVFYRLHEDGTLWQSDFSSGPAGFTPGNIWRQVGARSDWISIWGGGGTALGLTSDGTIWTWGIDWSRKPEIPFSLRWQMLQDRVAKIFKPTAGSGGIGPTPAYQELPRPLMRLIGPGVGKSTTAKNQ
jgi:hypothetical protein